MYAISVEHSWKNLQEGCEGCEWGHQGYDLKKTDIKSSVVGLFMSVCLQTCILCVY